MEEQVLDRKDLKILAYKERLNQALEENADLRVEVTILAQQLQQLQKDDNAEEDPESS